MSRLAAVILHYGDPDLTRRAHASLMGPVPDGSDVFVLDNCSPCPYPGAWIRTEKNLYWAGALAFCLEHFSAQNYSHVWFLNNDIVFVSKPPVIPVFMARLEVAIRRFGPVGVMSPSVTANQYHPHMASASGKNFRLVSYVDGIAPLIDLKCWREVGLDMAGNPYGYGVDVIFSLQVVQAGWRVVVDLGTVLRHKYHATAGSITGFLDTAAKAEDEYMSDRLGPGWRNHLRRVSAQYEEW